MKNECKLTVSLNIPQGKSSLKENQTFITQTLQKCDQSINACMTIITKKEVLLNNGTLLAEKMHQDIKEYKEIEIFEKALENKIPLLKNKLADYYSNLNDKINNEDLINYKSWDEEQICTWIANLENGRFVPYIQILNKAFKNNKIKGNHLNFISKSDLKQFGVHIFIDRVDLCKHFKILCSSDKYLIMFYNRNIIC